MITSKRNKGQFLALGTIVLALLVAALTPSTAMAGQVFKCRDGNGRMIFSDRPCPPNKIQGDSEAHITWRQLKEQVGEAKSISLKLGASVEAIKQCKSETSQLQERMAEIAPKVRRLSSQHANLGKALDYLDLCTQCRTSAYRYCERAEEHLDLASNALIH